MKKLWREFYRLFLDRPYESGKIKFVNGTSFSADGKLFVCLCEEFTKNPAWVDFTPGETYALYGRKWKVLRGLFVNGRCILYRTRGEHHAYLRSLHKQATAHSP